MSWVRKYAKNLDPTAQPQQPAVPKAQAPQTPKVQAPTPKPAAPKPQLPKSKTAAPNATPHAYEAANNLLHRHGDAAPHIINAKIEELRGRAGTDQNAARLLRAAEDIRHHLFPGEADFAAVSKHMGAGVSRLVQASGIGAKSATAPSPFGPDVRVPATPHPELPEGKMTLPGYMRDEPWAHRPERPRPKYRLVVPIGEAFKVASRDIQGELKKEPDEDQRGRLAENLAELQKAHDAGDENKFADILSNTIGASTFHRIAENINARGREGSVDPGAKGANAGRARIEPVGPAVTEPNRPQPEPRYGPKEGRDLEDLHAEISQKLREISEQGDGGDNFNAMFGEDKPKFHDVDDIKNKLMIYGIDWLKKNPKALATLAKLPQFKDIAKRLETVRSAGEDYPMRASRDGEPLRYGDGNRMPEILKDIGTSKPAPKPVTPPTMGKKPPLYHHLEQAHLNHGEGLHAKLSEAYAHFHERAASGDVEANRGLMAAKAMMAEHGKTMARPSNSALSAGRVPDQTMHAPASQISPTVESPPPKLDGPTKAAAPNAFDAWMQQMMAAVPPSKGVHPLPEFDKDHWWHTDDHAHSLRHGEEKSRNQIGRGINGAWKVEVGGEHPNSARTGIWKAADDDKTHIARPGLIPHGNAHGHEAAAWELAHAMGLGDLVPTTVSRDMGGKAGSLQNYVPDRKQARHSSRQYGDNPFTANSDLARAAAFDAAIMNTDRHDGNWLIGPNAEMTLIDHGLSFPEGKKDIQGHSDLLSKAIGSGTEVPKAAASWADHWPTMMRALHRNGLNDDQIKQTRERIESLAESAKKGETFKQWLKSSGLHKRYAIG